MKHQLLQESHLCIYSYLEQIQALSVDACSVYITKSAKSARSSSSLSASENLVQSTLSFTREEDEEVV